MGVGFVAAWVLIASPLSSQTGIYFATKEACEVAREFKSDPIRHKCVPTGAREQNKKSETQ